MSCSRKTKAGGALAGAAAALFFSLSGLPAHSQGTIHRVVVERFAFVPATLTVRPGDTVIWINRDYAPHTATAKGGGWGTRTLAREQTAKRVFRAAGTFDYFCKFHPHMRGRIVVAKE